MIPIADHEWTSLTAAYATDNAPTLPPGHKIEAARIDGGGYVVRITGPNAHVLGEDDRTLAEALDKAWSWFQSVGGAL